MFAVSLNHKTATLELRQRFAFDQSETERFLSLLRERGIDAAVYVSTCNRCEIYGTGDVYLCLECLENFSDNKLPEIKSHILIFEGESAVRHLFSVCCGFESMVMGEDEILGQVKRAFLFSLERGMTNFELNTVFRSAVTGAKKVKTQTLVSKTSVSIATIAASVCHKFSKERKKVLIIGAGGEIGAKLLKNLLSYNDFDIFAAVRKKHIAQDGIETIEYEKRYRYIDAADIVICATKSPHFIFTFDRLREVIQTKKPRLFIDLSVPRDIDGDTALLENTRLLTIDDFETIAGRNSDIKEKELLTAQAMIEEQLDELLKELSYHKVLASFKALFGENESSEIMRFIYKFRDTATAGQFASFVEVIEKMEGKK